MHREGIHRVIDPQLLHHRRGAHVDKAAQDADALVILTEWDQFRALDLDRIKAALNSNVVVDLRNIYSPEDMAAKGFAYTSIGRPAV